MTSPQSVTVVVPCFNREDTVREAINSVLSQDYPNFNVIAVDDNSTDLTKQVLDGIDDPRLTVVTNPGQRGPSSTRNHAVSLTVADWIAFQDSDDIWLPGKLSRQMQKVADDAFIAVYCGMLVKADTDPDSPVQKRYPGLEITHREGDILPSLAQTNFISTQMMAVRRDIFLQVGGFDEDLPALVDWDLMLQVASKGHVGFVDDDLVVQRMSDNSITRSTQKRLGAQEFILAKHHALLTNYPAALAHHHHRIAGGHRSFGNYKTAAKHAVSAWRMQRSNLRYLANALWLKSRGMVQ